MPRAGHELGQSGQLVAGAHGRAEQVKLEEEHPPQVDLGQMSAGAAADDDTAAGDGALQRVVDCRCAHCLDHDIDALGQPCAGLDGRRAERGDLLPLGRAPAGGVYPGAERLRQHHGGRGDAPARALHQHRVPGLHPALAHQHLVSSQPGGRQAGRLDEGHRRGLGHEIAGRHPDDVGEGARVQLGQQGPLRVERLVAAGRVADDRSHDDLGAIGSDAGRVAAEHHGQLAIGEADPAQRPQVVVVQRARAHLDADPVVGQAGRAPRWCRPSAH